jgi:hypothetical protein
MAVDCGSGCLQRSFEPAGVPLASVLPFAISAISLTDVREDLCFKIQKNDRNPVLLLFAIRPQNFSSLSLSRGKSAASPHVPAKQAARGLQAGPHHLTPFLLHDRQHQPCSHYDAFLVAQSQSLPCEHFLALLCGPA